MKRLLIGGLILILSASVGLTREMERRLVYDDPNGYDEECFDMVIENTPSWDYSICGIQDSGSDRLFFMNYSRYNFSDQTQVEMDARGYGMRLIDEESGNIVIAGKYSDYAYAAIVDEDGNKLDSVIFSTQYTEFRAVALSDDDGFIFVGTSPTGGLIVKTDDDLDVEWSMNTVGTNLFDIESVGNDNYIVVGDDIVTASYYPFAARIEDEETYGSIDWDDVYSDEDPGRLVSMALIPSGLGIGCVAVGHPISFDDEAFVLRIDGDDGDIVWAVNYNFHDDAYDDYLFDIILASDNNFVAVGDEGENQLAVAVKFDISGEVVWDQMLEHDDQTASTIEGARAVAEGPNSTYIVAGTTREGAGDKNIFAGAIFDLVEPWFLTIMPTDSGAPLTDPGYELNWFSYADVENYQIYYSDDVEEDFENWTLAATVDVDSFAADATDDLRFFRVVSRWTEGGSYYYSEPSSTIGYCKITAPGLVYMQGYATAFSLPFMFWDYWNGEPTYGVESFRPSDIIGRQIHPGDAISADKIIRQNSADQAYYSSTYSQWIGNLEDYGTMVPGACYWYYNKTGETHEFLLCGEVSNGGGIEVEIQNPVGSTYAVPFGWRESRRLEMSELGLIDGTDKFQGGDMITSDKIAEQGYSGMAYYDTATDQWEGYGAEEVIKLVPGRAYWIINKVQGTPPDEWEYEYTAP